MDSTDPLRNPEPFDETSSTLPYWMLYLVTAAGLFFAPTFIRPHRLSGATRSGKIKWEQRQVEIQQAADKSENRPHESR